MGTNWFMILSEESFEGRTEFGTNFIKTKNPNFSINIFFSIFLFSLFSPTSLKHFTILFLSLTTHLSSGSWLTFHNSLSLTHGSLVFSLVAHLSPTLARGSPIAHSSLATLLVLNSPLFTDGSPSLVRTLQPSLIPNLSSLTHGSLSLSLIWASQPSLILDLLLASRLLVTHLFDPRNSHLVGQ